MGRLISVTRRGRERRPDMTDAEGGAPGGAAPSTNGAERLASVPAGRSQGPPRGFRKPPGASRRSISSHRRGEKRRRTRRRKKNTGSAALA